MNKRSVAKKRPAKADPRPRLRKAAPRKARVREAVRQPEHTSATNGAAARQSEPASTINITAVRSARMPTVTVAQVVGRSQVLRAHKYRVGQTVFYTSSPISRPGATGSYEVIKLLPSDGDDYQYRIKNSGEAFERVAKESQLEVEL
jgi:hypothetical protein